MKPRHATALALVGWYLMVPMVQKGKPVESDDPPRSRGSNTSASKCGQTHYITFHSHVDLKAPFSKWSILYYSDSLRDCEAFLDRFKSRAKSDLIPPGGDDEKRINVMDETLSANAKCVAGDDPRLKRNEEIRAFQLMTPESRARVFGQLERELKPGRPNGK